MITQEDLVKHAAWLRGEPGGVQIVTASNANLSNADLRHADLRHADLRYANLNNADLRYANLNSANLSIANLKYADLNHASLNNTGLNKVDLRCANLSNADLRYADLNGADLSNANLNKADLRYVTNLSEANLDNANLRYADLRYANLHNAKNIPDYVSAATLIVPDGDLIVYKQLEDYSIATLKIPAEARRSNATGRKCRAEYAEVLAIESSSGESLTEGRSWFCPKFVYRVGEIVRPDRWCEDRWQECSGGIHFYLTRYEAKND